MLAMSIQNEINQRKEKIVSFLVNIAAIKSNKSSNGK